MASEAMNLQGESTIAISLKQHNSYVHYNIHSYIHKYIYSSDLIRETSLLNRKRQLLKNHDILNTELWSAVARDMCIKTFPHYVLRIMVEEKVER